MLLCYNVQLKRICNLNQMSQKSNEKRTIMDYLPQHEKAKIRKLVQRLAQQTQQKQKYKRLYEEMSQKYDQLSKKYTQLQQHNNDLKSQIATSRMAINKAKQAYIASKSAKKLRKIDDQENIQNTNQQITQLSGLKQTWLKIPKNNNKNNPISSDSFRKQYIFQQNQNNLSKSNNQIQKSYPSIPLPMKTQDSGFKQTRRSQFRTSSNKKQQIINLRREIQNLTQQMKKKQTNDLPLNQKIRKCQEIKNRYLKGKQKRNNIEKQYSQSQQQVVAAKQLTDQKSKVKQGGNNKLGINHKKEEIGYEKQQVQPINHYNSNANRKQPKSKIQQKQFKQQIQNIQSDTEEDFINSNIKHKNKKSHKYPNQQSSISTRKQKQSFQISSNIHTKKQNKSRQQNSIKVSEIQQAQNIKNFKNKKETKRSTMQPKFDQSLFAIIDQLNSGN